MYTTLNDHYKSIFGCKVYKLSLDGGFTCPNRDGTLGTGGCIFCSGDGSGAFAQGHCGSLAQQLEKAKERLHGKEKGGKYIAYFQSFTNTYAPVEKLRKLYEEALSGEEIVGLAVGTRPDCLPQETVELLGKLNRRKPVYVELGLQTVHEASVNYIRRGYENAVYVDAVRRLKAAGINVVTHIIRPSRRNGPNGSGNHPAGGGRRHGRGQVPPAARVARYGLREGFPGRKIHQPVFGRIR
jgi:radical SAM protein (TIGR01212 family)